ncbi:MAG: anthranilate phosphoribosyltransferase, partial [Proteobacteria bacterium]|nr:anthranilate phosphoribosyltransferase [Pseudomonadota bacterium]
SRSTEVPVGSAPDALVDTCGTGGDEAGTFNVSTTASFVVAGAGLTVAKHGNRSVSSRCGSADVIEALGVNLDLTPEEVGRCIDQVGIGFLFAPLLHPAMRHAVLPRREVKLKSIFNLVGPLTNPARADVQVLGVFRDDLTETLARVLDRLGCRSAYVVHGLDGLDEISISAPTRVTRLKDGGIETFILKPEDLGLRSDKPEAVRGGDAAFNAALVLSVLKGGPGPCRDMVLLNAAPALAAAGAARDLKEGVKMAAGAIDSGQAMEKLQGLIETSRALSATRIQAVGA